MAEDNKEKKGQPRQKQTRRPGLESQMRPKPVADDPRYKAAGKLSGRVALNTTTPAKPSRWSSSTSAAAF
jgi:hypothetical protein